MAEEIGGVDSQSLAQATAAAVANNPLPEPEVVIPPGEEPILEGTPPVIEEVAEPVVPEVPVEPVVPVVEPVEPEQPALDETTLELARLGIDLGVNRNELPDVVKPMYDEFAQQAIIRAQQWSSREARLQDAQAEIQQFALKLQNDPQKVLLTMAVTNPDAFREAVQSYERMSEDDFYRETVIKDLQAEAKLAATERQARVFQERQVAQKVSQVTRATHLAADRLGVDRGMAEELVASAITRGGGDIELNQVSGIVARLAPAAQPTIPPQEKAVRTAQAPTSPVQGQGTPAVSTDPPESEISPGLTRANRNPFLDLVRGAASRVRSSE
jgi:hypothetical protein